MVNVNFTIDEIHNTLSVEPLHHFHDNGRGYFYIWSPRQKMSSSTNGGGLMRTLHKTTNLGGTGGSNGIHKPKYCIKVPTTGVHTINIHPSDIGSPHSAGGGQPTKPPFIGPNSGPNSIFPLAEHYPDKIVRGGHGFDATEGHSWWFMYRYEWSEQGEEFVDTIVSERGVGGFSGRFHRGSGYGHPIGRCGAYTYPVIQNAIAWSNESMVVQDKTMYSVTCGGETKNKQDIVADPYWGVGDEYGEGISITRPEIGQQGFLEYKNKWRMYYPQLWPESVYSPSQATGNAYNYMSAWDFTTTSLAPLGYMNPAQSNNIPGSSGATNNTPWYNQYPERNNISQIARSNTDAWNRIDKIENPTGVEFISYRHTLIQKVSDANTFPPPVTPTTWVWEHMLVDQNTGTNPGVPVSSTPLGAYPEPAYTLNGVSGNGWLLNTTQFGATATSIGPAPPIGHNFYNNHPIWGEFTSRIYGIVRKSSTLDVCGAPQVGVNNPDKNNKNWRNGLYDTDPTNNGPYFQYWLPHVPGAGSTSLNYPKDGGRGSISRFMSTVKRPWTGDPWRSSTLIGSPITNPENWPDMSHQGSKPDYTSTIFNKYIGKESWKWLGYDIGGYTTTSTHPSNSVARPSLWPKKGNKMRNWIGHMNNASAPYWNSGSGVPITWGKPNIFEQKWILFGTARDANSYHPYWSYGGWDSATSSARNRFCLPSIKELDSPSYFNHIVTFEEEEDTIPDYGLGNGIHTLGYNCNLNGTYGPVCQNVLPGNPPGAYATYIQCSQQCSPNTTI